MKKNSFLTGLAKKYAPKIEYVAFCELEAKFGEARRKESYEVYKILIDPNRAICFLRVLFILFHEIGHIVLFHLGYRYYMKNESSYYPKEVEADLWAFEQIGIIDKQGSVRKKYKACHSCMLTRSKKCLKGLFL